MVMMTSLPSLPINYENESDQEENSNEDIFEDNEVELTEECIDDVIYNVKLKKVTQSMTSPLSDGLVTKTRKVFYIKAATLDQLASKMSRFQLEDQKNETFEKNFINVFLETFRSYVTSDQLLDAIFIESSRIDDVIDSVDHAKLSRSWEAGLRCWVEKFFRIDFYSSKDQHPLLMKLLAFAIDRCAHPKISKDEEELRRSFVDYLKEKLQEARFTQLNENDEDSGEMKKSESFFGLHHETEIVCLALEEYSTNIQSCRVFLNDLSAEFIATQMSIEDAKLFLKVAPHMCMKAVRRWDNKPVTIKATIDRFNSVVYNVLSTTLCPPLKLSQRVKIICKWIEVALFCHDQRNFASLHAITSSLQTHAVVRLKRVWQNIPSTYRGLLDQLASISPKDHIMKPGVGKWESGGLRSRLRKDAMRKHPIDVIQTYGTIPYLGHIFHDLIYLNSALPDLRQNKINFEKCRREFEYVAQLHLWQVSCKGYRQLVADQVFTNWFDSIDRVHDVKEAEALSEKIQPRISPSNSSVSTKSHEGIPTVRRNSSCMSSGSDVTGRDSSSSTTPRSSVTSLLTEDAKTDHGGRNINIELILKKSSNKRAFQETKLNPNHRTNTVIKEALKMFQINQNKSNIFELIQIFENGKELKIPDGENVFYAMNSSEKDFNFILLENGAEYKHVDNLTSFKSSPLLDIVSTKTQTPRQGSKKQSRKSPAPTTLISSVTKSPIKSIFNQFASSGSYSLHHPSNDVTTTMMPRRNAIKPLQGGVSLLQYSPSIKKLDVQDTNPHHGGWKKRMKELVSPGHKSLKLDHTGVSSKTLPRIRHKDEDSDLKTERTRKTHFSMSEYDGFGSSRSDEDCIPDSNINEDAKHVTSLLRKTSLWTSDPCLLDSIGPDTCDPSVPVIMIEEEISDEETLTRL